MNDALLIHYRQLITRVESSDQFIREGLGQYKAKFLLADGSNLRVSQVWIDGALIKYSYYWLDESDNLIAGWDNAPHHPEIKTHPHHLHTADDVSDSSVRALEDVLTLLSKRILK
ncbi:MAG: hypothetical protein HY868_14235 [Chloroflexi bacterium]|nr:hypothetical protein [Chloroflexota bacterium]